MDKVQLLDKYGITKYLDETTSTFMSNLTKYLNTGINVAFLTAWLYLFFYEVFVRICCVFISFKG